MSFVKSLHRFIDFILVAPPKLGPTFLNKVDLADAYMRIWVRLEDIPSVAFFVPKVTPEEDQLVGFHLSILMGHVEPPAFFCVTTETFKDRKLDTLSTRHNAPQHHFEDLADTKPPQTSVENTEATLEPDSNWEDLSPHTRSTALDHVKVYLDDFIGIFQGGPTEQRQMTRYLFLAIDDLLRPNDKDDTEREEPISLK